MTNTTGNEQPDLSKLSDTYDMLANLHDEPGSWTYLARHRDLDRDVTITVVLVPQGGANNALTHFASDARLLATLRHENIVPVLEGRWLDDQTFAVVRVLVRGSTLDQALSAVGQFPLPRVARTLEQVNAGLDWARQNGVVHRHLTQHSICFQQGSGRVMMSLELAPLAADALPDACSDAHTVGALAWSMLAGRPYDAATTDDKGLADLRPELDPGIVCETEAMLACETGGEPRDIGAFVALLGGAGSAVAAAAAARARAPSAVPVSTASEEPPAPPVAATAPETPTQPATAPSVVTTTSGVAPASPAVGKTDEPAVVIASRRRRSPVAAAVAIAAVILIAALFLMRRHNGPELRVATSDTTLSAGAIGSDTGVSRVSPMAQPPTTPPAMVPQAPIQAPGAGVAPVPITPAPVTPIPPAATQPYPPGAVRPGAAGSMIVTPPRTAPPPKPETTFDTAAVPADPCNSPAAADQRACFTAAIARGDASLNRVYRQAIAALRTRANVSDDDPDPESVEELRAAQRVSELGHVRDGAQKDTSDVRGGR